MCPTGISESQDINAAQPGPVHPLRNSNSGAPEAAPDIAGPDHPGPGVPAAPYQVGRALQQTLRRPPGRSPRVIYLSLSTCPLSRVSQMLWRYLSRLSRDRLSRVSAMRVRMRSSEDRCSPGARPKMDRGPRREAPGGSPRRQPRTVLRVPGTVTGTHVAIPFDRYEPQVATIITFHTQRGRLRFTVQGHRPRTPNCF